MITTSKKSLKLLKNRWMGLMTKRKRTGSKISENNERWCRDRSKVVRSIGFLQKRQKLT
eukprot:UN10601